MGFAERVQVGAPKLGNGHAPGLILALGRIQSLYAGQQKYQCPCETDFTYPALPSIFIEHLITGLYARLALMVCSIYITNIIFGVFNYNGI